MADEDINKAENFMNSLNRLGQTNGTNEDIDKILSNLLSSSLAAPTAEELNDIDDISCEYTELNNTIDALNSYLDVWEERHRNLREKVRAALVEGEVEDVPQQASSAQDLEISQNNGADPTASSGISSAGGIALVQKNKSRNCTGTTKPEETTEKISGPSSTSGNVHDS
ncbi:hypothetical protein ElyMa_003995400 [Elysia marginata]|uniref:Uncharacterized protein n=1 Tax=Elysia marginata TaxID=1093978 RepID=A0AAV4FYS2_9GAST|nr:hypothetical protein ElyMa_003995400 [Elysia marginata]